MKKLLDWITNHPIYLFIMQDNRPLPTIQTWRGETVTLSREIYVYTPNKDLHVDEADIHLSFSGTHVRLISGLYGHEEPGYHPTEGWTTVCPAYATGAVFLGVLESEITLVK